MTDPTPDLARPPGTALVTGANTGIGRIVALRLAAAGWRLLLAGRSAARTQATLDEIARLPGASPARFLELDLGDLGSVAGCAAAALSAAPRLELLIANAGVAGTRGLCASGFELAFGVNHVGHFALCLALWPALAAAPGARLVVVASRAHRRLGRWTLDDVRRPTASLTGIPEYARSKLANILFAAEFARRARPHGVLAYSLHPGVLDTEIWRAMPGWLRALNKLRLGPAEDGATTTLHCALRASAGESGLYFAESRVEEPTATARDPALAADLWTRSLAWTGVADIPPPLSAGSAARSP
jgi:retinol dehydrogenase-12